MPEYARENELCDLETYISKKEDKCFVSKLRGISIPFTVALKPRKPQASYHPLRLAAYALERFSCSSLTLGYRPTLRRRPIIGRLHGIPSSPMRNGKMLRHRAPYLP
ncbi:hypothetical protein CIHG_02517 [Coccidioides immitis H538.4]|uniref:Uncharacterized protein n=1 Tax=Coccidioides immitis H538.4 TaxID=396776 RepID=A0A0J8UC21_COCIT|nr:hypothetical protein CIHG_02517 [Coccidioides immitis H538.4]